MIADFPPTRFMGSKARVIPWIIDAVRDLQFETVLDAFSGSGVVSYAFKRLGKRVYSNDHMRYCYTVAHALIENNTSTLGDDDLELLLDTQLKRPGFVERTFQGLYFSDEENRFIDNLLHNIRFLEDPYKQSLARAALTRACLKKRPRGVFTYVGTRYLDGRRDEKLPLRDHFVEAIRLFNNAVYDNGQANQAFCTDVFDLDLHADLVYLDPPYYTPMSDNDYVRRYHFLEGICCNWQGVEILYRTKTKKLRKYDTPFSSKIRAYSAFEALFRKFSDSIIVLSYSSNGLPTRTELLEMLRRIKCTVKLYEVPVVYSFGTHSHKPQNGNNRVREYIFVAY